MPENQAQNLSLSFAGYEGLNVGYGIITQIALESIRTSLNLLMKAGLRNSI
jgi:hypothetical protein